MNTATSDRTLNMLKPGDLKSLATTTASPCISIFMPTHRAGHETQQGAIRLKNLLDQAGKKLRDAGHDPAILQGLQEKLQDGTFWNHQGEGLAIFATPDDIQCYRLSEPVAEQVVVGDAFDLRPLIGAPSLGGAYFVLALTWDDARLLQGSAAGLSEVQTDELPAKFHDLVLPRDPEESLQHSSHMARGNRAATQTAMFHGHGEGEDKIEADRRNYLSRVGDLVASEIYNTGMPLVVVATQEVAGHFEAATDLEIAAKVEGSPAEWTAEELAKRADEAIEPQLNNQREGFNERYGTALAQKQASGKIEEVLIAAIQGRIDSLLVASGVDRYGKLDDSQTKVTIGKADQKDNAELISQAVTQTLRNGGNVFQCDPEEMPEASDGIAAIYRY